MERMTRNDAAAYLGVDPQTITNWVNKGQVLNRSAKI